MRDINSDKPDNYTDTEYQTNAMDIFYHEILEIQNTRKDKVLNSNNKLREFMGLPKRGYDRFHRPPILKK